MSYNEEDKIEEMKRDIIDNGNDVEELGNVDIEVVENENTEDDTVLEGSNEDRNIKEKAYDKLPFTYKQVDIFTKVLIGVFAILIIYLIVTSNRMPWN